MRFPCFAVVKGGKMMSFATLEENAQHAATPGSKVVPCVIIPRSECEQDHNELTCFEIRAIFKTTTSPFFQPPVVEKSLDILLIADNKKDASFYGMFWAKNRSEQLTTPGENWEPIRVDVGVYHILRPDSDGRIATKREMLPFFQWRADHDKPFGEALVQKLAEANNPRASPAPEPGGWTTKPPTANGWYWIMLRNNPLNAQIVEVTVDGATTDVRWQDGGFVNKPITHWMPANRPEPPEFEVTSESL